ncbi:MAG: chemotaxis protein CheA [Candidatus Bathyarchaeota archaeon]|nr:chemotaxis protein CheA [Candidatus Bathyarchaeota archaeon]
MSVDMSQYRQLFIEEAREHIDNMTKALLVVEKDPKNTDALNSLFRSAHTLKGSSAMMGFKDIADLTHAMEDVFDKLRKGGSVTTELVNTIFECIDVLSNSLDHLQDGIEEFIETEDLIKKLKTQSEATETPAKTEEITIKKKNESTKSEKTEGKLEENEESTSEIKPARAAEAKSEEKQLASVSKMLKTFDSRSTQTIRIHFKQLDKLMNLTGELVINKIALLQTISTNKYEQLKRISGTMDRLITELQDLVTRIRMVPVSQIFDRFPRLVRDLSLKKGKRVELIMEGRDIEVDRTVLDEIGEPLVHLIRNCIDHGIEYPEERTKLGKPPIGLIKLSAHREGDHVIIEIEDDGAGIDPRIVKKVAVEKGFISKFEAEKMSDDQLINMIFIPGFSTAKEVTETSGRGVGMDVVKNKVEALGGAIQLKTEVSRGTKVTLRLPLTVAIIKSLLVEAGGQTFAIPSSHISEVVRVPKREIKNLGMIEVIEVRGKVVPILRLHDLLKLDNPGQVDNYEVVITNVDREGMKYGIIVDSVLRLQEILIKPLDENLLNTNGFSGATILGDGQVVLVLDIHKLINNDVMDASGKMLG